MQSMNEPPFRWYLEWLALGKRERLATLWQAACDLTLQWFENMIEFNGIWWTWSQCVYIYNFHSTKLTFCVIKRHRAVGMICQSWLWITETIDSCWVDCVVPWQGWHALKLNDKIMMMQTQKTQKMSQKICAWSWHLWGSLTFSSNLLPYYH